MGAPGPILGCNRAGKAVSVVVLVMCQSAVHVGCTVPEKQKLDVYLLKAFCMCGFVNEVLGSPFVCRVTLVLCPCPVLVWRFKLDKRQTLQFSHTTEFYERLLCTFYPLIRRFSWRVELSFNLGAVMGSYVQKRPSHKGISATVCCENYFGLLHTLLLKHSVVYLEIIGLFKNSTATIEV